MNDLTPPVGLSMSVTPANPDDLLARAVLAGASPETLEKLLAAQERWQRNQGRRAFDTAMAAASAEFKPITKNREVSYGAGKTSYKHEDLAEIERAVKPALNKHGIWYRYRTDATDPKAIKVTVVLSHDGGYFEENSLCGPADASGSKNPLQAIGSAVTYLQRYALKAALGLAAAHDDDAVAANGMSGPQSSDDFFINADQEIELIEMIERTGRPVELFLKKFNLQNNVGELPASKYADVLAFLANYIPQDKK